MLSTKQFRAELSEASTLASTSPSTSWQPRTIPGTNGWSRVTYGNGTYVAVSSSGTERVASSSDGITWTSHTAPVNNDWRAVTYGNGIFVAVANAAPAQALRQIMTSSDGTTWTARETPTSTPFIGIAFGNNIFAAAAADEVTNSVMTSSDGIIWTMRSLPGSSAWTGIAYGNGKFLVRCWMVRMVTIAPGVVPAVPGATSTDGINWTMRDDIPTAFNLHFCGGFFFTLNPNFGFQDPLLPGTIGRSVDGITWTSVATDTSYDWSSITKGNSNYVVVSAYYESYGAAGGFGNHYMYSPDAITWKTRSDGPTGTWSSITSNGTTFVAVGAVGATGTARAMTLNEAEETTVTPGQNALFYDDISDQVRYSTVTPISNTSISTFSFQNGTLVAATTTFASYITSSSLPVGVYYVYASWIFEAASTGHLLRVRINSNDTNTPAFGNYGDLHVRVSNVSYSSGTCGIGNIINPSFSTFAFEFQRGNTTALSMRGGTLTCLRISDL